MRVNDIPGSADLTEKHGLLARPVEPFSAGCKGARDGRICHSPSEIVALEVDMNI